MIGCVGETAQDVGAKLRAARARAGSPSYTTIERALIGWLGTATTPRAETIRTYHGGGGPDPAVMNLELIEGLARVYGCRVEELSEVVAERLRVLLVSNSAGRPDPFTAGAVDGAVTVRYAPAA